LTWGFVGFGGWLFWLCGDGELDGGVDEFEGAALFGGCVGEFVDFDVGVVVGDSVAGEGGQVVEQVAADRRRCKPVKNRRVRYLSNTQVSGLTPTPYVNSEALASIDTAADM
jgi:hypothetical protein